MGQFKEHDRLEEVLRYDAVKTSPPPEIDDIVTNVARIFDVPIVLVSLVEEKKQWFLSKHGLDIEETSRTVSFCDHVILARQRMIVEDAREDPRFACNPLVTGEPGIRAYMGAPLMTERGHVLGSLCVIDNTRSRRFSSTESALIDVLARSVMAHLELRRARRLVDAARRDRTHFISQLSHELRGSMAAIQGYSELIEESVESGTLEEIGQDIESIKLANAKLGEQLDAMSAQAVAHDDVDSG